MATSQFRPVLSLTAASTPLASAWPPSTEERIIEPKESEADGFGHGGGDFGIVENFLHLVNGRGDNLTSAKASIQSHLMCFAAEKSRLEHRTVSLAEMAECAGMEK